MVKKYISAVGRRKNAVARVFACEGSGQIVVNGQPFERYFGRETLCMIAMQPLRAIGEEEINYDFKVNVRGGGKSGQAGALRLGIARILEKINRDKYRPILKKAGYLTRDPRSVERKKYGKHKARKSPQYSKR